MLLFYIHLYYAISVYGVLGSMPAFLRRRPGDNMDLSPGHLTVNTD